MQNFSIDNAIENCFNYYFSEDNKPETKKSLAHIIKSYKTDNSLFLSPYNVFLKITSQCNLRCKHCFYYSEQENFSRKNDFTTQELMNLIEYLVEEQNIIYFTITGGEPFLQKDILDILKYIKSKNVYIQVKTNATLITKNDVVEISKIFNKEVDVIGVSLDGANSKTNDNIRGKGNFEKTVNAIALLTEYGINVNLNFTLTSNNIQSLSELYNLCLTLKIKELSISKFKSCSDEQKYLEPNEEEAFIAISKLINLFKNDKSVRLTSIPFRVFDFLNYEIGQKLMDKYLSSNDFKIQEDYKCNKHEKITICADGRICLCPMAENEDLCLGNVRKESFPTIWEKRFDNIFFQKRDLGGSVCKKCKYLPLCNAGCPAEAYQKYSNVNSPDSGCHYYEQLIKK